MAELLYRPYASLRVGIGISLAIFRRFVGGGCEDELVARAVWTSQTQTVELENALEVREQRLDFLAKPARGASLPRSRDLARHVASALID
ncbi:hypothetical protein ACVIWU_002474 [Bradyrhizobium sp. USDA 4509]|nr:hypothetical protein [Bradyrhizobium sp. USDA 4545]